MASSNIRDHFSKYSAASTKSAHEVANAIMTWISLFHPSVIMEKSVFIINDAFPSFMTKNSYK